VLPTLGDRLEHILDCIAELKGLFESTSQDRFVENRLLRAAAERWCEIISEASRHIPEDMKEREAAIDWRRMADLGNRLRHGYHSIDPTVLWDIGRNDLTPSREFVERVIREERHQ
jgi:uncharacterized protein with HEPN domain